LSGTGHIHGRIVLIKGRDFAEVESLFYLSFF